MTSTTSTPSDDRTFRPAGLGTLAVIAWNGEHPSEERDMPFLLAYSLGDGEGGEEASAEAVRLLLRDNGLPVGALLDGAEQPDLPLSLAVEDGRAVVSMPYLHTRCEVPPGWLAAADARGYAYFVFTTRAWAVARPGRPVTAEQLTGFMGAEDTLDDAAHCLLPVGRRNEEEP